MKCTILKCKNNKDGYCENEEAEIYLQSIYRHYLNGDEDTATCDSLDLEEE